MTRCNTATRSRLLDVLLDLASIGTDSPLRMLEIGTDPRAGASAAELTDRAGGCVVSLSQSSHQIAKARATHTAHPQLTFRRQLPLTAGWPPGAPYDLVLSWEPMDFLPRAWIAQCAPGGRLICPVYLAPPSPAIIGLVHLAISQHGALHTATVALVQSGGGTEHSVQWAIQPAVLTLVEDGYDVSCVQTAVSATATMDLN